MNKEKYTKDLECIVKQMLQPLKNLPMHLVIDAISGHKVIPFDRNERASIDLLKRLSRAASAAGRAVNREGIQRKRVNEAGNAIEAFVLAALNDMGLRAEKPSKSSGKGQNTGYPDLAFHDADGKKHYLECKTYNAKSKTSSNRSFYLSPSRDFKVTNDGHHLILAYELSVSVDSVGGSHYFCNSWSIIDAHSLHVDVKYEFNSNNKRMYVPELILASGTFSKSKATR